MGNGKNLKNIFKQVCGRIQCCDRHRVFKFYVTGAVWVKKYINDGLVMVYHWLAINKLSFYAGKIKFMIFDAPLVKGTFK